jgi:prepilin-type N-terminal cleavage/methylation domain-containing protein
VKHSEHFPKGLTLMELLMVVFIILLVLSIGGNTYRDQRKHVVYNDSLAKITSMIKTARNYALTSRAAYDECQLPGNEVYVPEYGYGVYIERDNTLGQSRAVLFANTQADGPQEPDQYDELVNPCDSDLPEEEFIIPQEVQFMSLSINKGNPPTPISGPFPDTAVIIFRPPSADVTLAVNNEVSVPDVTYLNDLYMRFKRPDAPDDSSLYIHFNRIAGFPELEE